MCSTKSKIGDSKFLGYDNAPSAAHQGGQGHSGHSYKPQGQPQYPNQQFPQGFTQNAAGQSNGQFPQGMGSNQGQFPHFQGPSQSGASTSTYAQPGDIVKVKCECGIVLSFKYKPGVEKSIIICPKCQRKNRICEMQRMDEKRNFSPIPAGAPGAIPSMGRDMISDENDRTRLPGMDEYNRFGGFNPKANELKNQPMGTLRIKGSTQVYQLARGKNTIGKKADTSNASIQIETETRRMSREHLVIDAVDTPTGIAYYISLFKEKVNPTFIDRTRLEYGDKIRIENGTEIRFPDITVLFEIPGSDNTQLN